MMAVSGCKVHDGSGAFAPDAVVGDREDSELGFVVKGLGSCLHIPIYLVIYDSG